MSLYIPTDAPSSSLFLSFTRFTSNASMRLGARSRRQIAYRPFVAAAIPARDRVIDFGKYRGKMLGTLPSTYLRWVSKNLRARDFEEWSKLADEVLEDPVYKDRIEWEFAEGVLNGNSVTSSRNGSAVSELLEISERFGWDNNDKVGWSRVNFELLGTSKGDRIPRKVQLRVCGDGVSISRESRGDGCGMTREEEHILEEEEKRRERRERLKSRRQGRTKYGMVSEAKVVDALVKKLSRNGDASDNGGREEESSGSGSGSALIEEVYNPFPGREGLLKKMRDLNHRRRQL